MYCTVTQDPFTNVKDTSNTDSKLQQGEIANLESELLIKSKELNKMKNEKKELADLCSKRKVEMEKQLSTRAELETKLTELKRKFSIEIKDLKSQLKLRSLEIEKIKHEKAMLEASYKDDHKGLYLANYTIQ